MHVAPACAGSGEGSDHLGLLYTAPFPAFLQEAVSRTWTRDLMVTRQQLYHCAKAQGKASNSTRKNFWSSFHLQWVWTTWGTTVWKYGLYIWIHRACLLVNYDMANSWHSIRYGVKTSPLNAKIFFYKQNNRNWYYLLFSYDDNM